MSELPPPRPVATPPPKSKFGRYLPYLLVLAAIGGCGAYIASYDKAEDTPDANDLEYDAFRVCKDFVKDRLKSPGSAVFRNFFEDDGEVRVAGVAATGITVRSTVDADNSFGASIRNSFVCEVKLDGDTWRLQNISID